MSGNRHNKGKAERERGVHLCIVCAYLLSQSVNKSIKLQSDLQHKLDTRDGEGMEAMGMGMRMGACLVGWLNVYA